MKYEDIKDFYKRCEEHRVFVRSLSETQSEISKAVTEQTKLLYALQPRATEQQEN